MIIAVIQPFKLDAVRAALTEAGVQGMTVSEVRGIGRPTLAGTDTATTMVPKMKIEIVVEDVLLDAVLDAIQASAATGDVGDGKIFVADVGQAVRIRTGEMNEAAL